MEVINYRDIINGYHTLVGGTTGSGKSVLVAGLMSELMKDRNNRFILIDPKMVDLRDYSLLPQCAVYATSAEGIRDALDYAIKAMYRRYEALADDGKRKYTESDGTLYVIIDELADLLSVASTKKWATEAIQTLAMKGRASRVILIACTQSPARALIPAAVISNFTNRVALHCNDTIESYQMLGHGHPEAVALPLYGQAIIKVPQRRDFARVEIPFTSEADARAAVERCRVSFPASALPFCDIDDDDDEPEAEAETTRPAADSVSVRRTAPRRGFCINPSLVFGFVVFVVVYALLRLL